MTKSTLAIFPELAGTVAYDGSGQASSYHDRKASEVVKNNKDKKVVPDGLPPVKPRKAPKPKPAAPISLTINGNVTVNGNITVVNKTVQAKRREFIPDGDPHSNAEKFEDTPYYYGYRRIPTGQRRAGRRVAVPRNAHA